MEDRYFMSTIDIVTLAIGVLLLVLGYIRGFGKSLKTFCGGIVGIIISIFVCVAFGGMILGTELVTGWVGELNSILGGYAAFLEKIQAGVIIFYIALFLASQLVRIIVLKVVCRIFEAENKVMKIINRVLGTIFAPASAFVFLLLVLSVVKLADGSELVTKFTSAIDGSIIHKLYLINPIVLHL